MQTFLPYPSFKRSARILDRQRLGKQRIETKQIYLALTNPSYGWQNHPAVIMWKGYEKALLYYGIAICKEWRRRGYNDAQLDWFQEQLRNHPKRVQYPPWLGGKRFHASHKSNLVRKDSTFYRKYFPSIRDNLPYEWNRKG